MIANPGSFDINGSLIGLAGERGKYEGQDGEPRNFGTFLHKIGRNKMYNGKHPGSISWYENVKRVGLHEQTQTH